MGAPKHLKARRVFDVSAAANIGFGQVGTVTHIVSAICVISRHFFRQERWVRHMKFKFRNYHFFSLSRTKMMPLVGTLNLTAGNWDHCSAPLAGKPLRQLTIEQHFPCQSLSSKENFTATGERVPQASTNDKHAEYNSCDIRPNTSYSFAKHCSTTAFKHTTEGHLAQEWNEMAKLEMCGSPGSAESPNIKE